MKVDELYTKQLIRSDKFNIVFNLFKTIIYPILLFSAILLPNSILSKKATKEALSRERISLIVEILNEKNPETRNYLLNSLRDIYPDINGKFLPLENDLIDQTIKDNINKLAILKDKLDSCKDCSELETENLKLDIKLQEQLIKSLENKN